MKMKPNQLEIAKLDEMTRAKYAALETLYRCAKQEMGLTFLVQCPTSNHPFRSSEKKMREALPLLEKEELITKREMTLTQPKIAPLKSSPTRTYYKITEKGRTFYEQTIAPLLGITASDSQDTGAPTFDNIEEIVLKKLDPNDPKTQELLDALRKMFPDATKSQGR